MSNASATLVYGDMLEGNTSSLIVDINTELDKCQISTPRLLNRHSIPLGKIGNNDQWILGNVISIREGEQYVVPVLDPKEFSMSTKVLNRCFNAVLNDDIQEAYNSFQLFLYLRKIYLRDIEIGTLGMDIVNDNTLWTL